MKLYNESYRKCPILPFSGSSLGFFRTFGGCDCHVSGFITFGFSFAEIDWVNCNFLNEHQVRHSKLYLRVALSRKLRNFAFFFPSLADETLVVFGLVALSSSWVKSMKSSNFDFFVGICELTTSSECRS